jgi:hypothetical protein
VRDPDLKGNNPVDIQSLAAVHNAPDGQQEHCLRRAEDDGDTGSLAALTVCRKYIRDTAIYAIRTGLDAQGRPSIDKRTAVNVSLDIDGRAEAMLPIFYVYAGQALHALEDSYTHTLRDEADHNVRVVMNWIDYSGDDYDEARDGPAHNSNLDRCDDATPLLRVRREQATEASSALLWALALPGTEEEKIAEVDAVLDKYLAFTPGCTSLSRWCDAPEVRHPIGCSASGAMFPGLAGLAALLLFARRRFPRLRPALLLGAAVLVGSSAHAQPASESALVAPVARPLACVPGQQLHCGCSGSATGFQRCSDDGSGFERCVCPDVPGITQSAPGPASPQEAPSSQFGAYATGAVSIDNTALVMTLAGRYRLSEHWLLGVGAEWNPWVSLVTRRFLRGTDDDYASVIRRFPINDRFAARTSAHLGASILMFGTYGAPAGNLGLYAAFSFIGVEINLGNGVKMVVDPCEVAMPVPHITGVPIVYRQYRFVLGFQFGA